jgi:hypothetical protein
MKNHISKYQAKFAEKGPWELKAHSLDGIRHAVVIPILAEYPGILDTLHSLAMNRVDELAQTLIVCVVNNRPHPHARPEDIANNRHTLTLIDDLVNKRSVKKQDHDDVYTRASMIMESNIRLAYIDAASPGLEIPPEMGVGLARKIGMDLCLTQIPLEAPGQNLLMSLDADTLVEPTYLKEVIRHFQINNYLASVVSFAHKSTENSEVQEAIAFYEVHLRYYVLGLKLAHSPYAFHTIGSTITTRNDTYAMVRGMPKRLAAEDFYFLNKIAKLGRIGIIEGTTVFPSPRLSQRTPFGTGKAVTQLIGGIEKRLYDPEVYRILGHWLNLVEQSTESEGEKIIARAAEIHSALPDYLHQIRFCENWTKLKKNYPHQHHLQRQFHAWFDGLKTLKLIHHLTRNGIPKVPASHAITVMQRLLVTDAKRVNTATGVSFMMELLSQLRAMDMNTALGDVIYPLDA